MSEPFDTGVIVVGSGFGGAVAAHRFAEAGEHVTVLERGNWVRRDACRPDLDWFWIPSRHRFGMNDLRKRGQRVIPWLGAAVGGGSHVFAGTLKRAVDFTGYPRTITADDMTPYYERAEDMMEVRAYPRHGAYGKCRATNLLLDGGATLARTAPDMVEAHGLVDLAMQFAPAGAVPGAAMINRHGAPQRYVHPEEQSLLGGDIDTKNSLDKNYLHLAMQRGATIRPLTEVDCIEPLAGGGYRVWFRQWQPEQRRARRAARRWLPARLQRGLGTPHRSDSITARRVVLAAGAIGTTEILLRNRDLHRTLPAVGPCLGARYTTNGNSLSLLLPFRGVAVAWLGFFALLAGLLAGSGWLAAAGALAYYLQILLSRRAHHPDLGTTNSDYLRFRGPRGEPGGAYIESGRYPTPLRLGAAVALGILGLYRPRRYRAIVRATRLLDLIPPFGALARSWPIPLLQMGRDDAVGSMHLDARGRVAIDIDVGRNRAFYAYLDQLGKRLARACRAIWLPNPLFRLTGKIEVPHNQGGAPMGETRADGVVDHAGRVFGYDDLMVLDGSIIPVSPGPNPALTILALAERAMAIVTTQLARTGTIRAEEPARAQSAA